MSSMKRTIACAALLAWAGAAGAAPDAQAILAASDAIRNPGEPFALAVALVEYRDGRQAAGKGAELDHQGALREEDGEHRA